MTEVRNINRIKLVWDGTDLTVPAEMGQAREGQLAGTPLDNVVELAGRVCYDSLGRERSRDTPAYHQHIVEVGHLSVQEHANLTFDVGMLPTPGEPDWSLDRTVQQGPLPPYDFMAVSYALLNRPGLWVRPAPLGSGATLRITTNLRAVREWPRWGCFTPLGQVNEHAIWLGQWLQHLMYERAVNGMCGIKTCVPDDNQLTVRVVPPETDEEVWVSTYIHNVSRGLTHELVRHGDYTAISQRSTRYVDEAESDWEWHPLFHAYFDHIKDPDAGWELNEAERAAKYAYKNAVQDLMSLLVERGVDKTTARKQARGAARGVLGNALSTDLIFSASIAQWKRMTALRAHPAADAEIRLLFVEAFDLLSAKFPDRWVGWYKEPSPDGIGDCVYPPKPVEEVADAAAQS